MAERRVTDAPSTPLPRTVRRETAGVLADDTEKWPATDVMTGTTIWLLLRAERAPKSRNASKSERGAPTVARNRPSPATVSFFAVSGLPRASAAEK